MKLAEYLAREEYADWVAQFPGGPKSHGFGQWDDASEQYRRFKIVTKDRTLERIVEKIRDPDLKAALVDLINRE